MAAFAGRLADVLRGGDVVLLDGALGAGKTTLVRSVAVALGVDAAMVSSPTFTIVHVYPAGDGPAVTHVDAFRLTGESEEELALLGWDRLVGPGAGTITLIEWGERVAELVKSAPVVRVWLEATSESSRHVVIDVPDEDRWKAWARTFAGPPPQREPTTCRVTGRHVPADSPTWPFADERARMADLYQWFSEGYQVTRPIEQADLEQDD